MNIIVIHIEYYYLGKEKKKKSKHLRTDALGGFDES